MSADERYAKLTPEERLLTALFLDPTVGDPPSAWVVTIANSATEQPHRSYGPIADETEAILHAEQLAADFESDELLTGLIVSVVPIYPAEVPA